MKTMKKCTLLLIVAFTFSLAAGIFGLTAAFNKTVFAGEGANVAMVDGASVKIDGTGIRFQSLIKKTYYDGLAEGKKTGIAIIPADLLQGELDQNTDKAMLLYAAAQAHDDEKYAGYYVYNYALTDIPETSFGRKITARAFVKNGEEYIWADNVQSRSLAYVASAALQADSMGEAKYTAEQKTALNGYIDGAIAEYGFKLTKERYDIKKGDEDAVGFTATPKYASDDLSDLKVIYTSNNSSALTCNGNALTAVGAGYAVIKGTLGGFTSEARVFIANDKKYVLSATAEGGQSIDFSVPEGYTAKIEKRVANVNHDQYISFGTSVTDIVIPDDIKEDKSQHKLYSGTWPLIICIEKDGTQEVFMGHDIAIATAVINTADDWKKYMWCDKGKAIYGYYMLGNTISVPSGDTLKNPVAGGSAETSTTGGDYGFRGTFDGMGYTLSYWGDIGGGLVNALGTGAIIKDIKIENNSSSKPGWKSNHIFGVVAVGTSFDNVTIDINKGDYASLETKYGPLTYDGFRNCTINNLVINVKGKVNTIIGGSNNTYFQIVGTTFKDCVVNLYPGATLGEIGHTGASGEPIYCGENQTIEGRTPLSGWTVNEIGETEQSLNSKQNVSVADGQSAAIDLGGYSDYTVTEITCDGEDLGKNPQNLALTENIKKK